MSKGEGGELMDSTIAKVLIVDGQEDTRGEVERVLRSAGYTVKTAEGGAEALEMLENDCFDIIITDLTMPDMNGIQLSHEIQIHYPYLPVIMMTEEGSSERAVEFIQAGGTDFLTKPADDKKLVEKIERAIVSTNAVEVTALQEVMGLIKEACNSTERQVQIALDVLSNDVDDRDERRSAVVAIKRIGEVLTSIPVMITSMDTETMKGALKKLP